VPSTEPLAAAKSAPLEHARRDLSAARIATPPLLAYDQRFFAAHGYLTLPALCDPDEVLALRALLMPLFRKRVGYDEGLQFDMLGLDLDAAAMKQPQIIAPSTWVPALLTTRYFQKVAAIARQLLGPEAHFSFDHAILKPARGAAETPWHQDEAHRASGLLRYRQISFWMPLQDTAIANGCMRYIPGSHLGPLLPHRHIGGDQRVHAIECPEREFDLSAATEVPATAGSCILHDGRTVHGAKANVSTVDRLAYVIAWTGAPMPGDVRSTNRAASTPAAANVLRRQRWLRHGGFLIVAMRRLRQGLRSSPKIIGLKLLLTARTVLNGLRSPSRRSVTLTSVRSDVRRR
jgi:hypothetical protein